jgi:hypothetical protein
VVGVSDDRTTAAWRRAFPHDAEDDRNARAASEHEWALAEGLLDPGQPTEWAHLQEQRRKLRDPPYRRLIERARERVEDRRAKEDSDE